ncbi:MAG: hypothetical protein Q9206_000553 [Seirophora lacunosa]
MADLYLISIGIVTITTKQDAFSNSEDPLTPPKQTDAHSIFPIKRLLVMSSYNQTNEYSRTSPILLQFLR